MNVIASLHMAYIQSRSHSWDTNGHQSSITKQVIKEAPAYPLSSSILSDISSIKYDGATLAVPTNSTIAIDNICGLNSFLAFSYNDHIVSPKPVGDSINLKRGMTASLWAKPDRPGVHQILYKHAAIVSNASILDGQWHHYAVTLILEWIFWVVMFPAKMPSSTYATENPYFEDVRP
eukprot:864308-Ditylum_brightwellii.AAC.1